MKSILEFADTEKVFDWNGWFERSNEREGMTGLDTFSVEYKEDGYDSWWKAEVGLTEEEATLMRNYENENYLVQFLLKSSMCRLLKNSEIVRLRLV